MDFTALSPDAQDALREKQRLKKLAKRADKAAIEQIDTASPSAPTAPAEYRSSITRNEYFQAARGGRIRCGPPTGDNLQHVLASLAANDKQARSLESCNYFMFQGEAEAVWDPTFNARLAYEGFFTITSGGMPLPELQPFYSVLSWPNFEVSKHVRKALARAKKCDRSYRLMSSRDPGRSWDLLEAYHRRKYGNNWLTRRYFDMMRTSSADPSVNFSMHCVELYDADDVEQHEDKPAGSTHPLPLAGEIGFSVGGVYTSLSGWTGERTPEALGTTQLVLLGRWLQQRGYAFWSLGHCYSPEMDYKRQLGHRIYPRNDFLALLREHRGAFRHADVLEPATLRPLQDGESCDARSLLEHTPTPVVLLEAPRGADS